MQPIIIQSHHHLLPEALVEALQHEPGIVLLRSAAFDLAQGRYSFVTAKPFLLFRSFGRRCEVWQAPGHSSHTSTVTEDATCLDRAKSICQVHSDNPWRVLESLMDCFAIPDECPMPIPVGGCFGFWGYDMKCFVEPKLQPHPVQDLPLPDCQVGFYDSLVVFDHLLGQTWIVSTGLGPDGSSTDARAHAKLEFWRETLDKASHAHADKCAPTDKPARTRIASSFTRGGFIEAVEQVKRYIRAGDVYQVNLAHRLACALLTDGWGLFERLSAVSPAPFAAYLNCGAFELVSSSPELFLRIQGDLIRTRPIKGTRPRTGEPDRDEAFARELLSSPKETAELVMITDLLRNDLGRICTFGSVKVPELMRLERFAQVQHLVATVEGRLRPGLAHMVALAACFPGGSVTGAPKFRAMQIIDELEPVARGPYTGALGYIGFNRQSQLSITIRTAICHEQTAYFYVGAGIVADSVPEAEYDETIAKAAGFLKVVTARQEPAARAALAL